MKKNGLALFLIGVLLLTAFAGCRGTQPSSTDGKLKIVATLFPQYDFARQIAQDKAVVELILPPGIESHMYEPTPGDMTAIANADLFIYTGEYMEPWAERVISGIDRDQVLVVDASAGVALRKEEHEHEEEDEHEEGNEPEEGHVHEYDPHIWLDPTLAMQMVDDITAGLCEKDAGNAPYYRQNAEAYKVSLQQLDNDISELVSSSQRKTIVFGGRFAYSYFVTRYGLAYESAFDSCSTEAEPSVRKIVEMTDFIRANNIPVIYYEELVDPKIARSIAEQTGIEPLLLHTVHNVSREEFEQGVTYLEIMRTNLVNLERGLN